MSTLLAALALREELGETTGPERPPPGSRRLRFVWTLYANRLILDDPPMRDAIGEQALGDLLRAYDDFDDQPADVVGPLFVDYARAVELADAYGATIEGLNLARAELEELTNRNWVIVGVGAHGEWL